MLFGRGINSGVIVRASGMRARIWLLLLISVCPLALAGQQQSNVSSSQRRRDWATKATADPRIANQCIYKTAGEQDEVLLIMCLGAKKERVEQIIADERSGISLYRFGFRTVIYSDQNNNFWGANLTETGYLRLSDQKAAETGRLLFPEAAEDPHKSKSLESSAAPEPPPALASYEQPLVSLKPWPTERQRIYKNYIISTDDDFTVAVALFTSQKASESFWAELHVVNHGTSPALFGMQFVTLLDAHGSQAYLWDKHTLAQLGWDGWTPASLAFYWTDMSIAPSSSNRGILYASLSPGTIGWHSSSSQLLLPINLKVPVGSKVYEFVFDAEVHSVAYARPQTPTPAPTPPHKITPVKWNGVHIGSPVNDPAIKASGCSYMGEGSEEFANRLFSLSAGKATTVCRLIADCPPPTDSPVKVCSEDLNHAWISQIWVVSRQPYSEVSNTLTSTYGPARPGLYRLLSNEPKPSYNLWQLQEGVKIAAKQEFMENLVSTNSPERHMAISVIYVLE